MTTSQASLSLLTTSGDLLDAPLLHGRLFECEEYDGEQWHPVGELAIFPNTAFLNREKLYNVHYHKPTNSMLYSYNKAGVHQAGRLYFTTSNTAFIGTLTHVDGTVRSIRGTNYSITYHSQRKTQKDTSSPYQKWVDLRIENKWEGNDESPVLHTYYYLGDSNVSARTAVSKVNRQTWETTIEMVPDPTAPFGNSNDSFQIVIAFGGDSFIGTYTDENGTVYDWKGDAETTSHARNFAKVANFIAHDGLPVTRNLSPAMLSSDMRSLDGTAPTLSVQDLNSITSIYDIQTKDGNTKTVDVAQAKTGEFFNYCLIDAVGDPWLEEIFGRPYNLPTGVDSIYQNHQKFFKDRSVLAVGQLLYDNLKTDSTHKDVIDKIKPDALEEAWKKLSQDPDYAQISQQLYIEGYRIGVPGIAPYLENDPKGWAKKYYQFLTNPQTLSVWQAQISSNQFDNIRQQMYEWYVKLSVLDSDLHTFSPNGDIDSPNGDRKSQSTFGQQMLCIGYSALLGVSYNKVRWTNDIAPFLRQVLENAAKGNFDAIEQIRDDIIKENIKELRETLTQMISTFDNIQNFVDNIINLISIWSNRNPNLPMVQAGDEIYKGLGQIFDERSPARRIWDGFKDKAPKVFGLLFYGAAAGYLIYSIVEDAKNPDITPERIIQDIGLGLLSLGLLVKGAQLLMSLGVGDWLRLQSLTRTGFLAEAAGGIAKWFTKEGVQPQGRLGKVFTTIFGESYSEFFAKRLGPAMAVIGIVMSGVWLYRAISTGDVRDIVFEAINLFFALADAIFIGLELLSFAWAGPVGLVIAGIGLIVALVQLIWSFIDPPSPPPDPIAKFVNGPMKELGFAH